MNPEVLPAERAVAASRRRARGAAILLPVLAMTLCNGAYARADETIVISSVAATANGNSIANTTVAPNATVTVTATYKAAKAFTETYCLQFSVDVAGKPAITPRSVECFSVTPFGVGNEYTKIFNFQLPQTPGPGTLLVELDQPQNGGPGPIHDTKSVNFTVGSAANPGQPNGDPAQDPACAVDKANTQGYREGHTQGRKDGRADGYEEAYKKSYNEAVKARSGLVADSCAEAKAAGYQEGYKAGYELGYAEGEKQGQKDGKQQGRQDSLEHH